MTISQHIFVKIPYDLGEEQFLKNWETNSKPFPFKLKLSDTTIISTSILNHFIQEEERHDLHFLTTKSESLIHKSSGEKKKALINYGLNQKSKFLVVINLLDHLDQDYQLHLHRTINEIAKTKLIIQIENGDNPPFHFISLRFEYQNNGLKPYSKDQIPQDIESKPDMTIPGPIQKENRLSGCPLVCMKNVTVAYGERRILNQINWQIVSGEFWQLSGANGSGKSTLISLITGDSHKGYGQDLEIFGHKKGSGESVWDLKKNIGYFTPSMVDTYKGYATVLEMILSGFYDGVGLYLKPTQQCITRANQWCKCIGLISKSTMQFRNLSIGEKRKVMIVRAMVKHPKLLLLDEPFIGLDTINKQQMAQLINTYGKIKDNTLVFVTHKPEPLLDANKIFHLTSSAFGSNGTIKNLG